MGSFVNQLTSPVGIKLFSGGPVADNYAGDKLEANANAQQKLSQDFMAKLGPIIAQIAQSAGVTNPISGEKGQFSDNLYGLSPLQQGQVNQQASIDTEAYDNILKKVKANLSARGLASSDLMSSAEAYLKKQMVNQVSSNQLQAGQNAYNTRIGALDQIGQLLGTGYGAQQSALGNKNNVYQYQGQVAEQSHNDAMRNLGQAIGLGVFGGQGGFNNILGGGKATPAPLGAPVGTAGAAGVGGMVPGASPANVFAHIPWSSIYG